MARLHEGIAKGARGARGDRSHDQQGHERHHHRLGDADAGTGRGARRAGSTSRFTATRGSRPTARTSGGGCSDETTHAAALSAMLVASLALVTRRPGADRRTIHRRSGRGRAHRLRHHVRGLPRREPRRAAGRWRAPRSAAAGAAARRETC